MAGGIVLGSSLPQTVLGASAVLRMFRPMYGSFSIIGVALNLYTARSGIAPEIFLGLFLVF